VRHEYSPGFGFEGIDASTFSDLSNSKSAIKNDRVAAADRWEYWNDQPRLLRDSCVEPSTQKSIFSRANGVGYVDTSWVDYILTTANSWKTPIKRFELIVERGPKRDLGYYDDWDYASFCWDGPVKKVGPYRYEASATHFVPKRELKVLFLAIPVASTTSAAEVSHSSVGGLLRSRWVWVGMVLVVVVLAGVGWGWVRTRPKFGNPSTRLE
jgi:hypothetical protein